MSTILEKGRAFPVEEDIFPRSPEEGDDTEDADLTTPESFPTAAFQEIKGIYDRSKESIPPTAEEIKFLATFITETTSFLNLTLSDYGHITFPPEWQDSADNEGIHQKYLEITNDYDEIVPELLESQRTVEGIISANFRPYKDGQSLPYGPVDVKPFMNPEAERTQRAWEKVIRYGGPIQGVELAELQLTPKIHIPLTEYASDLVVFTHVILEANNHALPLDENNRECLEAILSAYRHLKESEKLSSVTADDIALRGTDLYLHSILPEAA